jgi:hypothetical protein
MKYTLSKFFLELFIEVISLTINISMIGLAAYIKSQWSGGVLNNMELIAPWWVLGLVISDRTSKLMERLEMRKVISEWKL